MLKVLAFLKKKEGIETRAFIDYYEKNHVPLVCSVAPSPPGYKRNYVLRGHEFNIEDSALDFDVVTELVFPDRAAFLAWIAQVTGPGAGEQVAADEEQFLDRSRTRVYVVEEWVTSG